MTVRVLSIAGSDSGGGAGIQADIKTITAFGGHALTAVTAITAQNTVAVTEVLPLPPSLVLAQIDAVAADIGVDAVKIGMLGSPAIADAVAARLTAPDLARVPVVFDPVMVATSGAVLADAATAGAFAGLLARATVATPNLAELAALAGYATTTDAEIAAAAGALVARYGRAVLATGIPLTADRLGDRLFAAGSGSATEWSADRIATRGDHGTGCTLSTAIACGLAAGLDLVAAIARARDYVRAALLAAPGLGRGHGPMGHGLGRAAWPG